MTLAVLLIIEVTTAVETMFHHITRITVHQKPQRGLLEGSRIM
jgi:hypothetical protein